MLTQRRRTVRNSAEHHRDRLCCLCRWAGCVIDNQDKPEAIITGKRASVRTDRHCSVYRTNSRPHAVTKTVAMLKLADVIPVNSRPARSVTSINTALPPIDYYVALFSERCKPEKICLLCCCFRTKSLFCFWNSVGCFFFIDGIRVVCLRYMYIF